MIFYCVDIQVPHPVLSGRTLRFLCEKGYYYALFSPLFYSFMHIFSTILHPVERFFFSYGSRADATLLVFSNVMTICPCCPFRRGAAPTPSLHADS